MMKIYSIRVLVLTLVLISYIKCFSVTFSVGGINYSVISEDEQTVSAYYITDRTITLIPSHVVYNDVTYTVIEIGSDYGSHIIPNNSIAELTIPNTVKTIRSWALNSGYAYSLKKLTILDGDSPLKIEANLYGNYSCGIEELYLGREINGGENFPLNRYLKQVTFGVNVHTISASLFSGCTGLETIELTNNIEVIEKNAFAGCTALKSLTIPASVIDIGNSAFKGCTELTSLTLADGEQVLTIDNTGNRSYSEDQDAFCNCPVDQLYVGRSVSLKGDGVYSPFPKVTGITMGPNVKEIPKYMFTGCNILTSVQFGDGLENIGEEAFLDCSQLPEADIKKCTTIDAQAFKGCSSLASLKLPEGLENIEASAFYECAKLKDLVIPASVTEIGSQAFAGCTGLKSIKLADGDDRLTIDNLSFRIFEGCKPDYFYLGRTISSSEKTNIITNVGTLEIGNLVKSIYPRMFQGCDNMEELTIGGKVSSIGEYAFSGSTYLATVYCNGKTPPVCKSTTFYGCPTDARLYVPKSSKATYASTDYWKDFGSIVETNEDGIGETPSVLVGDVDGDGVVDIADAVRIVNLVVGKINSLAPQGNVISLDPQ